MGNGQHGFTYPIPERLKDEREHTLRIRAAGTGVQLPGSPITVCLR
jgi:hypothetical protein